MSKRDGCEVNHGRMGARADTIRAQRENEEDRGANYGEDTGMERDHLIDKLNEDLAGELSAIIQYIVYAAKASGPYRPQLAQFFLSEVSDERAHAEFLANKIAALGGEPTTEPRNVPAASTNREMVEAVLVSERKAVSDYTERAQEAERAGDKGLAVQLEDMVRDETGHLEESQRLLQNWSA